MFFSPRSTRVASNVKQLILERQKEFELDLDIDKTIDICRNLCREQKLVETEGHDLVETDHQAEPNPLLMLCNDPGSTLNSDMYLATLQSWDLLRKEEKI